MGKTGNDNENENQVKEEVNSDNDQEIEDDKMIEGESEVEKNEAESQNPWLPQNLLDLFKNFSKNNYSEPKHRFLTSENGIHVSLFYPKKSNSNLCDDSNLVLCNVKMVKGLVENSGVTSSSSAAAPSNFVGKSTVTSNLSNNSSSQLLQNLAQKNQNGLLRPQVSESPKNNAIKNILAKYSKPGTNNNNNNTPQFQNTLLQNHQNNKNLTSTNPVQQLLNGFSDLNSFANPLQKKEDDSIKDALDQIFKNSQNNQNQNNQQNHQKNENNNNNNNINNATG